MGSHHFPICNSLEPVSEIMIHRNIISAKEITYSTNHARLKSTPYVWGNNVSVAVISCDHNAICFSLLPITNSADSLLAPNWHSYQKKTQPIINPTTLLIPFRHARSLNYSTLYSARFHPQSHPTMLQLSEETKVRRTFAEWLGRRELIWG